MDFRSVVNALATAYRLGMPTPTPSSKNVGNLDAAGRSALAVVLLLVGLVVLDGLHGRLLGLLVALTAALPIYMVVTRRCFVFRWFGLNSIPKSKRE
jgi:hypothetical protein